MATSNDRNNLSSVTARLVAPDISPTEYRPPVSVQKINDALDRKTDYNIQQFPIDRPKYYMMIEISDYQRAGPDLIAKLDAFSTIILPLPMQLEDSHGVIYTQEEIGFIGAAIAHASNRHGSIVENAQKAGSAVAAGIAGTAVNALRAVPIVGQSVGRIQNAVNSVLGVAPNQFMTVLLKGPAYKKFTFQWKLAPRNEQESRIIYQIINRLNDEMAPSTVLGGLLWQFPSVFRLQFSNKDKMYQFKPAVLENMSINYTASGTPAFYTSGFPESVILTMNFLEMEFWLKGQFHHDQPHKRPGMAPNFGISDYFGSITNPNTGQGSDNTSGPAGGDGNAGN
jgi:hypothetical protein